MLLNTDLVKINPESLRAIRTRSGWSVGRFAAAVGIGSSHLSNIEAGRRQASPEVITEMARVLDVPVMALISARVPEAVA